MNTEIFSHGQDFLEVWSDWLKYKKAEFKFSYKSEQSKKAALKKLNRLSNGNEETAIAIIEESMANGWKGFWALKEDKSKVIHMTPVEKFKQQNGI